MHNDILSILDAKSMRLLPVAFDTINHDLWLSKLSAEFGFSDAVLEWFFIYLNKRS